MPVSPFPILFPLLLIGIPLACLPWGRRPFLIAAAISALHVALLFLAIYGPGGVLMVRAYGGDPAAMYRLAQWTETHDEQLGEFLLWPIPPNVLGGFAWLERAAARDYPPAVYAVGVRLKQGHFVPRPPNWKGPEDNCFPQPERGQPLIEKALKLGYRPTVEETRFYWTVYRR